MTIVLLEALTFGLARLATAAAEAEQRLCLLTGNRSIYFHELDRLGPEQIEVIEIDTTDIEACAKVLAGIPDLVALVNSTDTWALPAAELAERFGLPTAGLDTFRILRDKSVVRNLLHEAGLSRAGAIAVEPNAAAVERAVATVGYPAIVKDASGTSSRSVWLVRDDDELRRAAAEVADATLLGRHLVVEPYFPGPVYSAETVSWDGQTRLIGISAHLHSPEPVRREEAIAFPVGFPAGDLAFFEDWIGQVLAAVGFREGLTHSEFALTTDGPEVVEINGRIAGAAIAEMMCRSLEVNVHAAIVEAAMGRRPLLMDAPLIPRRGYGEIFLYPPTPGTFLGWRGVERLELLPGSPEIFPTARPGDRIVHLADQRGTTAMLMSEGATAELGLYHALTAAGAITHDMRPLD